MSLAKVDQFIKDFQTISQKDIPDSTKKKSLVESGITDKGTIDILLKMKRGVLTKVQLALDDEDASDCVFSFRLLSTQEQIEIDDELMKLSYIKGIHFQYELYLVSKTLSRATKPIASDMPNIQPEITEEQFRKAFPVNLLLAIGNKYSDFVKKVSPQLEIITQDDIDIIIQEINEEEDKVKKSELLNGLSWKSMQEVLINCVNKLGTIQKQLDKFVIGS